jgi:tetratricopeptide (TPR) repeat protein
VEDAQRLGARATARERGYIGAVARLFADHERVDQRTRVLAYERAMADLVARQPADTEARIFHAIALTATALPTDKTYANQLRAGRILESIWTAQPDHPGLAHYIIHAYDHPPLADRARLAAQRYARIAPAAAHALHMPSHTFTRMGAWDASVETNLRSIEAALRSASIAEALHASDYVVYAYLQMRRLPEAKRILDGLPALAARFDPNAVTGAAPGAAGVFALAAIPARYALERRDWAQAARLAPATSAFPWTEAMVHFARALGATHTGDLATARTAIDSLSAIERRLRAGGEGYWAEQVAIQHLGARAWLAHAEHRDDAALATMREAAAREDATDKSAVTPGPLAPARELLGDLLLELGRPAEALVEYRAALRTEPNRHHTVDGARRAAAAAGERAAAGQFAAQLRRITGS